MKVLQILNLLNDFQPVSITPICDLDWGGDNPYMLHPDKVRDLKWRFVRAIGDREVAQLSTNGEEVDGLTLPYLSIEYK